MDHFAQRCAERGITRTNPATLKADLSRAIPMALGGCLIAQRFVEHVIDAPNGAGVWRFRVLDGVFYAVVHLGHPRTVLTQEMLARFKAHRRGQRVTPRLWDYLRDMGLSASEIKQGRVRSLAKQYRWAK